MRNDYVELLITNHASDLETVISAAAGELLNTRLPKTTRFLVLDSAREEEFNSLIEADYRVLPYSEFVNNAIIQLSRLQAAPLTLYPVPTDADNRLPLVGRILRTDSVSGQVAISDTADALGLIESLLQQSANVLLVGRPGSGKTTLLKEVIDRNSSVGDRLYCYIDLGLKRRNESLATYISRLLNPYTYVEPGKTYELFQYLVRGGVVVCALDAIDEAVAHNTLTGYLELFAEVSELLSAKSLVVMTTRVSFFEDSPHVRQLLDRSSITSEKLVEQLHAHGVDPLQLPRFSILRVEGVDPPDSDGGLRTPLEIRLLSDGPDVKRDQITSMNLADLVWARLVHTTAGLPPGTLDGMVRFFGAAFVRSQNTFELTDILNALGIRLFDHQRVSFDTFRLRELFRAVDAGCVSFGHSLYQEILAAEYLQDRGMRKSALHDAGSCFLTEQLRSFVHLRNRGQAPAAASILSLARTS